MSAQYRGLTIHGRHKRGTDHSGPPRPRTSTANRETMFSAESASRQKPQLAAHVVACAMSTRNGQPPLAALEITTRRPSYRYTEAPRWATGLALGRLS